MTAQKGKDLLLKIDSDGEGTFTTVAGLRSRQISFNAETVDISNADSTGRWREKYSDKAWPLRPGMRITASKRQTARIPSVNKIRDLSSGILKQLLRVLAMERNILKV